VDSVIANGAMPWAARVPAQTTPSGGARPYLINGYEQTKRPTSVESDDCVYHGAVRG